MARVIVTGEDGVEWMRERVNATELASDHFRTCLAERVAWAVEDAQSNDSADEPNRGRFERERR